MTEQDNRPRAAADLRQKTEALGREKAARTPEDSAARSPEEIRETLNEPQVHQIELEMQNEELREAQAEIEAGRVRNLDLFDLAPWGYCTLSAQGLILEANLTAATLLGTFLGAMVRQPFSRFILEEDHDIYYLHRKQLFEAHSAGSGQAFEPHTCELRLVKPNGAIFWALLTGTAARAEAGAPVWRVVMLDITERKRAEAALHESRVMYEAIFEATGTATMMVEEDTTIVAANGECLSATGYSPQELVGTKWPRYVAPESLEQLLKYSKMRLEDPSKTPRRCEVALVNKDGEMRDVILDVSVIPGTGRSVVSMLDITERRRLEGERKKLQAQLIQAQKLESVGRLAGGVAHDFNNKLGIILGYTELALGRVGTAELLRADLEEIQKAAQCSADLTCQLLTFARKQTVAPKVLDLNQAVAGMLRMLGRLIGESINLTWKPGEGLWPVKIDPAQLDQMLANLCVNARDAIADVGEIVIETENASVDEACCADHPDVTPGDYALLAVSDNGCGIDAETFSHLFEPFFTTKDMGKGSGLGLASIYGAVKQNNGFINAYSEPGHGTRFTIYLRRHVVGTGHLSEQDPARSAARGSETVLLVEDEPAILRMATRMLEGMGYVVLAASTPTEAIHLAGAHRGPIDLLMTDVVMPEMNGRDLAKQLRAIYPGIARLFMSGYTADFIAHQGVLDEGVHFIQKPFSLEDLGTKLREALEG